MEFGVVSTADIGLDSVIPAIRASEHRVAAIASRDADRAAAVAADLDIPRSYGSYEALLADEAIDAVYNPLPNGLHAEWTRRAADAGLHVLCEKPLTASAAETAALFDYCADRGVTLMEAFMYRFGPRTERARAIVEADLGEVVSVTSAFTFRLDDPDDVRLDPDLAGGSVLDVGCYAISAARLFCGVPDRVFATTADPRDAGVDTRMAATLTYDDGRHARVESGFDAPETQYYRVGTTDGWLRVEPAFGVAPDEPTTVEWGVDGRTVTETVDPADDYRLEVEAFADAVASGATPRVDREESVGIARTIDAIHGSAAAGAPVAVDD